MLFVICCFLLSLNVFYKPAVKAHAATPPGIVKPHGLVIFGVIAGPEKSMAEANIARFMFRLNPDAGAFLAAPDPFSGASGKTLERD